MKTWTPLAAITVLSLTFAGCSTPTRVEEEKDPRTTNIFELYSLLGGRVDIGPNSPHLWEGEDDAIFIFSGGLLDCFDTYPSEKLFWTVFEPPEPETGMVNVRAEGSVIAEATCELVGHDSILFRYPSTGETIAASVRSSNGCWHLDKALPSEETLRMGIVDGDEIPDYVSLPELMPKATFRELFCDVRPIG